MASDFEEPYYPNDTLRIKLTLEVDQSQPYAEFTFKIPAGARLSGDAIEHTIKPSSSEAILTDPRITREPQEDPLKQKIRIEPLSPGTHEFVLPYIVSWGGTFSFPAHLLVYPKSGQSYQIGSAVKFHVEPASD